MGEEGIGPSAQAVSPDQTGSRLWWVGSVSDFFSSFHSVLWLVYSFFFLNSSTPGNLTTPYSLILFFIFSVQIGLENIN